MEILNDDDDDDWMWIMSYELKKILWFKIINKLEQPWIFTTKISNFKKSLT